MIYLQYHLCLEKYNDTKKILGELLDEKEELFAITQPKGIDTTKEAVSGGKSANAFEAYMIRKEETKIEERIREIEEILAAREMLLKDAEMRLKQSLFIEDRIYKMRYLDRTRVFKIARKLNYSESNVYKILDKIDRTLKRV